MRGAQLETKGTVYNRSVHTLTYADDVDIVGLTLSSVEEAFLAHSAAAKTMELKVNKEKTKFMQLTKRLIPSSKIQNLNI
jgi:hypothetical protein